MRRPQAGESVNIRVDPEVFAMIRAVKYELEMRVAERGGFAFVSMNRALRELLRRAGVGLTGDTSEG